MLVKLGAFVAGGVAMASQAASSTAPPRNFTVTSFDRVRVEGPYDVTLAVGRASFARAEGSATALDLVDLRVEGRTLVIRQRGSGGRWQGNRGAASSPIRIALGTPELRSAAVLGSGSLAIDRLRGLSADLALQGSGRLGVATMEVDRLSVALQGTGVMTLAGRAKSGQLALRGSPTLAAGQLQFDQAVLSAEGSGEATARVRTAATIATAGTGLVRLLGTPACTVRAAGSARVEGCR